MPLHQSNRDAQQEQQRLITFLEGALDDGHGCRRIDTHAASIFLAGDRAWKLKRAVKYPYLDFSTPPLRRRALEAELNLNRRTAPDMYLAVHPVVHSRDGFRIGGEGEPVDWLLEMRRFPDGALLADIAETKRLETALLIQLANRVHAFHQGAVPVRHDHGADAMRQVIHGNAASLARFLSPFGPARVSRLIERQQRECEHHVRLLDERARTGMVRRTHGDLHLANIAVIDGGPVLFDCLEFSDELATTDTLYDLAFLLMDLRHKHLQTEANILFNRYIDLSADEAGVRLLPLFMSVRATIRAHVAAARAQASACAADRDEALQFLSLSEELLEPRPIALAAIGGLSGTGKSAVARLIAGDFGPAPGARVLRTDIFRKRLARVSPEERLPEAFYTPLANRTVYQGVNDCARRHISSGTFVIVDAVLAADEERLQIERVAGHSHVPFIGCWLEAAQAKRLVRVRKRSGDASDADERVVRLQSSMDTRAPAGWHPIRADAPLEQVASAARSIVAQALNRPVSRS